MLVKKILNHDSSEADLDIITSSQAIVCLKVISMERAEVKKSREVSSQQLRGGDLVLRTHAPSTLAMPFLTSYPLMFFFILFLLCGQEGGKRNNQ